VTDWREVLYQMAVDYFKYNTLSNFEIRVRECNPDTCPIGRTNYEQYYTDIQVCWRQLYNPTFRTKIEEYETKVESLTLSLDTLNTEIKSLENTIIEKNNSLNEATTQTQVDSITYELMAAQKLRNDKKAVKT
jgi:hypothetical protein